MNKVEESIIYLPTQCEDNIQISRVEYDTFLLEKKRKELNFALLSQQLDIYSQQLILSSLEKFSYTIYFDESFGKSYFLFNHFCFLRNYVCYQALSFEDQKLYLHVLKEFLSLFSFEFIGIVSWKDYENRYPESLVNSVFDAQKRIALLNQFVLRKRDNF